MEIDGIFVNDEDTNKIINEVSCYDLDSLNLAHLGEKIDVTGAIKGKIEMCKMIGVLNIPIQLINGLKEN